MPIDDSPPQLTYVGGPTILIEWNGVRLLTDPTFDPAGTAYVLPGYTLRKLADPAIPPDALGGLDVVLLSHDHHFDNLDHRGRALLADAGLVLTTRAAAGRLEGNARGLDAGETRVVDAPGGGRLRVTATPARHGPEGGDRGPVVGFLLEREAASPPRAVWVTGDTVWYPALETVGARTPVEAVIGFFGAARVAPAGPSPLTLTAADGVRLARHIGRATIVPVHYEGWEHFSEGRAELARAFEAEGLAARLQWLQPGRRTELGWPR